MRRHWRAPRFLGPLFGYDLVASTRRGQHAGLRVLIAAGLLVVLFFVYLAYTHDFDFFLEPFKPSRALAANELASFATSFAVWCLIVQLAAVLLLTPAVVADAIAREKERRSLDFLLVTDLTSREIILGKLGARLAYLVGVLLTGLPILALTQLFGGVDPGLLFAGYAALFATLLSLGALSMLCSVSSQTALQATVRAYVAAVALLATCGCLLVQVFVGEPAWLGVLAYAGLHLVFAAICLALCVRELRPWAGELMAAPAPAAPARRPPAVRPAPTPPPAADDDDDVPFVLPADEKQAASLGWDPVEPWGSSRSRARAPRPLPAWEPRPLPRAPLPPVSDEEPLLWKEVYLHSFTGRSSAASPLFLTFLMITAVLAAVFVLLALFNDQVPLTSNLIVRTGTVILGGLLGLGALAHAANSVTRERERDTLDGLLTLPVERAKVLEAKWLGGLVSLERVAAALGLVWLFGLLTGGVHPLALGRLALAVAAPVEFLASLGLWLSVVSRTSLRANLAAALCLLLVASGPWIVANYVEMFAPSSYGVRSEAGEVVIEALTPPLAWVKLCLTWADYRKLPPLRADYLLAGALVYAVAAGLLWRAAVVRFREYGGRTK